MGIHFRHKKRKKGDTAELAAHLAPLEEQDIHSAAKQIGIDSNLPDPRMDPNYGAIVVDSESINVPKGMSESAGETRFLGMEPVVIVILIVMLTFIFFIAWQVSLMPNE
jgi:hypothetical protein